MDIYALHHVLLSLHVLLLHEDLISSITYEYPESLGFQPDLVWTGVFFLVMTLFVNYNIFNRSFWKSYMLESRILTTLSFTKSHTHTHTPLCCSPKHRKSQGHILVILIPLECGRERQTSRLFLSLKLHFLFHHTDLVYS